MSPLSQKKSQLLLHTQHIREYVKESACDCECAIKKPHKESSSLPFYVKNADLLNEASNIVTVVAKDLN